MGGFELITSWLRMRSGPQASLGTRNGDSFIGEAFACMASEVDIGSVFVAQGSWIAPVPGFRPPFAAVGADLGHQSLACEGCVQIAAFTVVDVPDMDVEVPGDHKRFGSGEVLDEGPTGLRNRVGVVLKGDAGTRQQSREIVRGICRHGWSPVGKLGLRGVYGAAGDGRGDECPASA